MPRPWKAPLKERMERLGLPGDCPLMQVRSSSGLGGRPSRSRLWWEKKHQRIQNQKCSVKQYICLNWPSAWLSSWTMEVSWFRSLSGLHFIPVVAIWHNTNSKKGLHWETLLQVVHHTGDCNDHSETKALWFTGTTDSPCKPWTSPSGRAQWSMFHRPSSAHVSGLGAPPVTQTRHSS